MEPNQTQIEPTQHLGNFTQQDWIVLTKTWTCWGSFLYSSTIECTMKGIYRSFLLERGSKNQQAFRKPKKTSHFFHPSKSAVSPCFTHRNCWDFVVFFHFFPLPGGSTRCSGTNSDSEGSRQGVVATARDPVHGMGWSKSGRRSPIFYYRYIYIYVYY